MNRKALRTTSCATSYDFQGPILGHKYVYWLVSGSCKLGCSHATYSVSWHTVQFIMYRMAKGSTLWSFGTEIVFFFSLSLSLTLKRYPVL